MIVKIGAHDYWSHVFLSPDSNLDLTGPFMVNCAKRTLTVEELYDGRTRIGYQRLELFLFFRATLFG